MQAQNRVIDSLKNELKVHTQKDTIRVRILNNLAYYNYRNNPSKSLEYAELAAKLADEIQSTKGKARSFYMKGITYMEQGNYGISIKNYEKAIELYTSIDDLSGLAGCYNAMGVLNNYKGNLPPALEYFEKAMDIDQKLGEKKNMAYYLSNIGSIYSSTGKSKEALANFQEALQLYTNTKNQYGIITCLNSIAIIHQDQGNYPLALEYQNKALEIAKKNKDYSSIFQSFNNIGNIYRQQELYDKALSFYNQALAIKQTSQNPRSSYAIKSNMAGIYADQGEYENAIPYFIEVIEFSRTIEDNEQLAISHNGLGQAYLGLKKYPKALENFQEANKIATISQRKYDLVGSYISMSVAYYYMKKYKLALYNAEKGAQLSKKYKFLIHQRDAYELLSKINNELKEHEKAFISNQQLQVLNDSLFNRDNIQKMAEVEYEYKYKDELESAEKRELKLTQTVQTTTNDLEKSQRNSFIAIIIILLISIVLGSIIFYLKLRHVNAKNQNILIEQKLLRSQMTPHFIFNSLSVLQGMILDKEEKKSISYLSKFSKLMRLILENSREKTVSLSEELKAVENYLALQNLENSLYQYSIHVEETIDTSEFQIPPMLIQPFVENAIEHAFENQPEKRIIEVEIWYKDEDLICKILDNGIGIDAKEPSTNQHKNSVSTAITSERLKMLSKDFKKRGSVTVEDRKKFNEQGTVVTLVIPYKTILD
ncbi:tetratricopeptide repeat protein [Aquimarina litoralis]|uniref:tetratricopeptide repeat protein n=1 Tax=Aquimarina litoralis TaxID=584605 RepID=UPI001C5A4D1A|nr:tetratricopeptide repeat protein [Aquimarina litoralis]